MELDSRKKKELEETEFSDVEVSISLSFRMNGNTVY